MQNIIYKSEMKKKQKVKNKKKQKKKKKKKKKIQNSKLGTNHLLNITIEVIIFIKDIIIISY